jgi:hypothetical protein
MISRALYEKSERWLVILVATHSAAVGALLLLAPAWAVRFAGWRGADPLFFLRQAGVFHFVVVFGYLYEYFRWRGVTLLVVTKAMAFVFLVASAALTDAAWSVLFSGIADGMMGASVLLAHRLRLADVARGLQRAA